MKTQRKMIIGILILAILFRIFFVCKTNISEYQFDFGIEKLESIEDYDKVYIDYDKGKNEGRHINYIMYLYNFNKLPNKIIGQFYQPPLHHFILANWLKVLDIVSSNAMFKLESMQIVSLIYSIIILIVFKKIMDELEVKEQIFPLLIFSFYPLIIYLSGSLNNDQLVILFELLCLLYLIRWRKNPSMKDTILGRIMYRIRTNDKNVDSSYDYSSHDCIF